MADEQRKPLDHYRLLHRHRDFVRVRRGSGEIERDWILVRTDTAPYGCVVVHRPKPGTDDEWQIKRVELDDLFELNPDLVPIGGSDMKIRSGSAACMSGLAPPRVRR